MKAMLTFAAVCTLGGFASSAAQQPKTDAAPQPKPVHAGHETKPAGDMVKHMTEMNDVMMKHLGKKDPAFEKRFIDMMIPHHEGAILMAKRALKEANRSELKKMSEEIIAAQEKDRAAKELAQGMVR